HVWDVATGKEIATYRKHDNSVIAGAVSPDGRLAATAGGNQSQIHVWSLQTVETKQTLVGKGAQVWAVGMSIDGRRLAAGMPSHYRAHNDRGSLDIQLRLPDRFGLGNTGDRGFTPLNRLSGQLSLGVPERLAQPLATDWFRGITKYGALELAHRKGGAFGLD